MKIETEHIGKHVVLHVEGRLDVVWADTLVKRVQDELRGGRHGVWVDAAGVVYLSSAGIRALIQLHREVAAVHGEFFVIHPSEFVDHTLRMSGLESLMAGDDQIAAIHAPGKEMAGASLPSVCIEGMAVEVYPLGHAGMRWSVPARWKPWETVEDSDVCRVRFPVQSVGLGIGAAGQDVKDVRGRLGEFMAAAGCVTLQPADSEQHLPDFVTQAGEFVPEVNTIQALVAEGTFSSLLRFQPETEEGRVAFSDLAGSALQACGADSAVMVVLAETDGLVGMALSRSPGMVDSASQPGAFPEIRNWMNFCGERVHAGKSVLLVSFVSRGTAPSLLEPLLSAVPSQPGLFAHSHAAAFPFLPLPDGVISLNEQVKALFDAHDPVDLLHLVEDDRPLTGLGQSTFIRGACWCAVLHSGQEAGS